MKKYLFIAEKPSAMREYSSVYNKHKSAIDKKVGGEIDFTALVGHLFRNQEPKEYEKWDKKWATLYEEELPMIPDTWKLKPISTASSVIKSLKDSLKTGGYDGIIVGTDSDVEGYGIYYMIMEALGLRKYETLRFYEISMAEKDILQSFNTMEDLFTTPRHKNALNAFIFRSRWDWLIGMNLTTAYTVRYGELIKFGSVKAPTLKLIYDNCNAIDNFKQVTTYGIKSQHTDGFESILLNEDDNKDRSFTEKSDAEKLLATLLKEAVVKSFEKKTNITKAPKLYSLSDLQIDASKAPYGYTPEQTLAIAQKLYEERKILTYPRTSGNYLASGKASDLPNIINSIKNIPDIKPFILKITNADIARVSTDKNVINDKEVAKASHDALIPTGEKVDWNALTKPEQDIFLLVCKRLVAHFMPYFTEEKYVLMLDNNGNPFKANGRKTIENGFNDLYGKTVADVILPEYKKGDIVKIDTNLVYEKVSSPPARYSTGTIIKAMKNIASQVADPELKKRMKESEGIGTEATRANILKDLQSSGYISTSKNMIYITDAGRRYIENIRTEKEDGTFDYGIADPVQVAYWSSQNKEIQLGEKNVKDVLDEFYVYLNKKLDELKASGEPIKRAYGQTAEIDNLPPCPLCGGKVAGGKFGYYCSTYKESGCKLSIPNEMAGKKLLDGQKKNLLEGKKLHMKGFKSKAGKSFEADVFLNKSTGKLEFDFNNKK